MLVNGMGSGSKSMVNLFLTSRTKGRVASEESKGGAFL